MDVASACCRTIAPVPAVSINGPLTNRVLTSCHPGGLVGLYGIRGTAGVNKNSP
jgi:hypothetical protein